MNNEHNNKKTLRELPQQSRNVFFYLKPYWHWASYAVAALLLKQLALLIEPVIFRQLIHNFEELSSGVINQEAAIQTAILLMVLFAVVHVFSLVGNMIMFRWVNRFQSHVMRDASNAFVDKVINLSFRFHSNRKTGKLAKEFARGVSALETFMDAFIFNGIPLTVNLIVVFAVFAWLDWRLAGLWLIMAFSFMIFTGNASVYMQRRRETANKLDDEGSRQAMDALMNAETVKYFHQEKEEVQRFEGIRKKWQKNKQYEWDGWIWVSTGQILINVTSVGLIIGITVWQILQGNLQIGDFVLVITYLTYAIGRLWDFQHHFRALHEALTDLDAFFSYFKRSNEIADQNGAQPLYVGQGEIRFENVHFQYNTGKHVLNGVDFTIPAGATVAFIGPSGVGKSTIMKLLYRFYEVDSGRILIDGQDIAGVTKASLRAQLGIVPQETSLFSETVAYNIAYGCENVTMDDIQRVAKLAHADELINRLPQGFDTQVGERGVKLSGGEKQRISIARAFLRNAPILVLDEATASLDSKSEAEIQAALDSLMKQRTTLIIAHRLSTIMAADFIIVLNEGGVEQVGTHEELMQHGGLYQKLWQLQAGGYIS